MLKSLLIRWGVALVLVFATYNPTNLNFVRWAEANFDTSTPIVVLVGIVLLLAYVVFLRATLRSIGIVGVGMILLLIAAIIWVLYDAGIVSLDNPGVMTWIGLIALSFILGVGISWSIIRRRLTGQLDVDDPDTSGDH